ncbi:MAG: lysylphosphatidylglycerol synthase transmembrane domain-containing protein [Anaerolineales bacterium]
MKLTLDRLRGRAAQQTLPRWLRFLGVAVLLAALAVVGALIVRNWQAIRAYDWELRWWPLLVALPLYPLTNGLAAYLWTLLLARLGAEVRFGPSLYAFLVSNLARKLPTPVWFLGGRVLLAREQGVPESASSAALVIEQALSLLAAIIVALLAGVVGGVSLVGGLWRWVLIVAAAGCLGFLAWPGLLLRLVNWTMRKLGSAQRVASTAGPRDIVYWLLIDMASWVCGGLVYCCTCLALYAVPLSLWPALISLSALGGAVSFLSLVLPAGLGLREATTAAMLATLLPVPVAVTVPLLSRLWYLVNDLLWAAVAALGHMLVGRRHRKLQNSPNG